MWRTAFTVGALALAISGCKSSDPLMNNPIQLRAAPPCEIANPIYLPQGPVSYGTLWEMVLDVIDDYYAIQYSNRYDGRIVTFPKVAPGIGQPFKKGSPDVWQRLVASAQSMRHRAEVIIRPAEDGGFFVDVKVFKELEDVPQPSQARAGGAAFRSDSSVARTEQIVDPATVDFKWIPVGRDTLQEQRILERLQCWDGRGASR